MRVKTLNSNSSVVGRNDTSTLVLESMVLKFPTHGLILDVQVSLQKLKKY